MTNGTIRLTIDDLALLYPDQVFLEFDITIKDRVWQEIQRQPYPTEAARHNAYLNQLLVRSFLGYLNTDVLPDFDQNVPGLPTIWPSFSQRPTLWSWVNGSAIDLGPTRLVLIPTADIHGDELRIPREWVELPEWVGNFYLAAQVSVEQGWIQILGYATHAQIREQGRYERADETYRLDAEQLTDDLSALWMTYELCQNPRPNVSQPSMATNRMGVTTKADQTPEQRVAQLALTSFSLQRLALPFGEWAEVVGTAEGRRSLHTHLMNAAAPVATSTEPDTPTPVPASPPPLASSVLEQAQAHTYNLRQWLQSRFDSGWQALNTLLDQNDNRLVLSFRQGPDPTRELTVEGVKLIDLGVQLGHQPVALVIGLCEDVDQRVAVRIQVLPTGGMSYLPTDLTLTLTSQSGKVLQTLATRTNDNLMQLKRFTCKEGTRFTIQLALDDLQLTETFEVKHF